MVLVGCSVVFLVEQVGLQVVELRCKASDRLLPLMPSVVLHDSPSLSAYSGGVYSTPQYFAFAKGAGVFGEAGPEAIMPLTRGADGSLGVRAVGRESPAVQEAARQIEAQPRIAVSVDARSTFSGQPDDATMLAVDRRNAALERRIINTLTAEVNNPRRNSVAPSTQSTAQKTTINQPGGNVNGGYYLSG